MSAQSHAGQGRIKQAMVHLAREAMELPGLRSIAKPMYRHYFSKPYLHGNIYYGRYTRYEDALLDAERLSSEALPASYDVDQATVMYRQQLHRLRACDYPALYWIDRLIEAGARRIFDLGGHIGLAYYGFSRYINYPAGLTWNVHDLDKVVQTGRMIAVRRDPLGQLRFVHTAEAADGCDVLISTGALQYLEYSLPELLDRLIAPPRHVLFNLTPLHPTKDFFTLQNLGVAVCPYRVQSDEALVQAMAQRGYQVRDRWELPERHLRIPFEPEYDVHAYYGVYFERQAV
ncbi:methyltransferase, TIGR04325 family [Stenotrophomonas acidaminiphila]|jgi:putative methyltransferase (TIGR04325 family)|uniref:methyltransferase, TIGR04325 family n=1 Tax=Stenotrophomonas acidaminiphila TaxID=128780 RepID=UPI000BD0D36F|nr:methyltransferase, TIGR04325 family [Stenotrophomonas acidaminiphila]OZB67353.1 MAG: hypothetical protein B7X39_05095 [Xanthomonadales bacterium 14-68-21]